MNKLVLLLIPLLVLPSVSAGVGIVFGQEYVKVSEDTQRCIPYGVYNPWDDSVKVNVDTSGNLPNLTEDTELVPIPANTMHDESVPVSFCFDIPNLYEEDCLFWIFGCKRECNEENVKYKGEIIAVELKDSSTGGTGSKVTGMVSAPLTLEVECEKQDRNWLSLIALIGFVVFVLVSLAVWNRFYRMPLDKRRKLKSDRIKKKKEKLDKELKKL